ncbi:MAG: crotonase/enoyl-CoA hydratase family protein [Proteobacteria bacterium]|nr:crotonase/enoyl-CoA hydratase family protein [Pseudomonadota bacterium]
MLKYEMNGHVAVLTLDDGKANAVSHAFVDALTEGLDRAEQEAKAVVLHGRAGVFSAGFDLKELAKGAAESKALVDRGAALLLRVFSFPMPVVAASAGHAIAAGALLMLAADTRIGAAGEAKYGLNETAIGMSLPPFGLQIGLCRISKRHQTEAMIQATLYDPEAAKDAGFLDAVVPAEALAQEALAAATALAELPTAAYATMKLDVRRQYIDIIAASLA